MTPQLVLHVGAPKTGSTYLQKRMRADPAALRASGMHVPVLPAVARMAGNAKLLATALSRAPSRSFLRAFPEIDPGTLDPRAIVAELLADWRPDRETAILSAENFRPNQAQRLRELLPKQAACTVVLFVRRQDRWIESYHNQLIKSDDVHVDLATFVAALCDTEGERFCRPDWYAQYEAWRAAFGDCRIVFYDEARSDLFAALMAAADLQTPPNLIDVAPAQVSLDAHQYAYLQGCAPPATVAEFSRRRLANETAAQRLGAPPARTFLSAADRARLRERFDGSNRRLIAALGRPPGASPLDMAPAGDRTWTLDDVYASEAYAAHKALADELYAAEA